MSQSDTAPRLYRTDWVIIAWVFAAIGLLPLFGVLVAGRSVEPYFEFPPITHSVIHEPFSWAVFTALGVLIVVAMVFGAVRLFCAESYVPPPIALRIRQAAYSPGGAGWGLAGLCWPGRWLGAGSTGWARFKA